VLQEAFLGLYITLPFFLYILIYYHSRGFPCCTYFKKEEEKLERLTNKEYVDPHEIDKYKRKRFGCGGSRIKYSKNKIDNGIDLIGTRKA
jgi:hypothetical protein